MGLITLAVPIAAGAQTCSSFLGQTVSPKTFESAVRSFMAISPKGEFETSAQFAVRTAAALATAPTGPVIISKEPDDRKYFEYDADAQKLSIGRYALVNYSVPFSDLFIDAGVAGKLKASQYVNIGFRMAETDSVVGSYKATNAFGVSVNVQKIERITHAIFEREGLLDEDLFLERKVLGYLNLQPAEAQTLKPILRIAFVVVPTSPFVVSGRRLLGNVTVQNPRQITETYTVLIGDIQCGLLMDGNNKVLGSYPTR